MPEFIAKHSFEDNSLGSVKRKQTIKLTETAAKKFVDAGLLIPASEGDSTAPNENPTGAVGTASSASPAAPASPEKTANSSKRGRKKKAAVVSSS